MQSISSKEKRFLLEKQRERNHNAKIESFNTINTVIHRAQKIIEEKKTMQPRFIGSAYYG